MRDTGQTPSRTRREVLAGLAVGAAAWTAPQVLSVARAGAMSDHTITVDVDGARIDGGAPVPFTWAILPFDSLIGDLSEGGQIDIDTAGCLPITESGGLQVIPYANRSCRNSSGGTTLDTVPGVIGGSAVSFPIPPSNPVNCTYLDFTIKVQCSS